MWLCGVPNGEAGRSRYLLLLVVPLAWNFVVPSVSGSVTAVVSASLFFFSLSAAWSRLLVHEMSALRTDISGKGVVIVRLLLMLISTAETQVHYCAFVLEPGVLPPVGYRPFRAGLCLSKINCFAKIRTQRCIYADLKIRNAAFCKLDHEAGG